MKFAPSPEKAKEKAADILGMMLITPQTPPQGKLVRKVLITEDVYYKGSSETKEFYISVLMDRAKKCNVIIYSTEGGMDIEKVAEEWERLRIASVLKVGGVVGLSGAAEITGLAATVITNPWEAVLMKVLCGSLVASAAISTELKGLLPARNAVKQHPLYFTESIFKKL